MFIELKDFEIKQCNGGNCECRCNVRGSVQVWTSNSALACDSECISRGGYMESCLPPHSTFSRTKKVAAIL